MRRIFVEHRVRRTQSLDGRWDFVVEPDRQDRGKLPGKYPRDIHVPSAWDTIPGLETYRGRGWLRTRFVAPEAGAIRLAFGGVSHLGTVYVDGKRVGRHYDAFVPWDVVVPGLKEGEHELVVEVENTFGDHSALHQPWAAHFSSGGITRPVEFQPIPAVYIDRMLATPVRKGRNWGLDVRVTLRNLGKGAAKRRVVLTLDGVAVDLGLITVRGGASHEVKGRLPPARSGAGRRSATGLRVASWTAETPRLYDLSAELFDGDEVVDDLIDRIGFRQVEVKGDQLLLNGKPLRLRGYNRHEYHAQFGSALPVEVMAYDLQLLRDLGCNFIRTSHYPNDLRFLDLCDSLGFYVWEETNSTSVSFKHPKYREQITADAHEMVRWHFNRPSILIWGCLNECGSSTKENRKEHARVLGLLRKLDPSRPVTFASNCWTQDICLDLVDIVSWNWYEGWYWGSTDTIEEGLQKLLDWQDSKRSRGGKGKPVILSEFGAGGIYGTRQRSHEKWSEEYQCDVLDATLRVYLNHPRVMGVAIWQFCDVRVAEGGMPGSPNSRNNKGTFDDHHRPKLCYDVVKKRMHEAKSRPIASAKTRRR